jgi:hypothetical protein
MPANISTVKGCATCKKKRLKCDEKKPSCDRCEKARIPCEGYRKQYRWRSVADTPAARRAVEKRDASARALAGSSHIGHPDTSTAALSASIGQWSGLSVAFANAARAFHYSPTFLGEEPGDVLSVVEARLEQPPGPVDISCTSSIRRGKHDSVQSPRLSAAGTQYQAVLPDTTQRRSSRATSCSSTEDPCTTSTVLLGLSLGESNNRRSHPNSPDSRTSLSSPPNENFVQESTFDSEDLDDEILSTGTNAYGSGEAPSIADWSYLRDSFAPGEAVSVLSRRSNQHSATHSSGDDDLFETDSRTLHSDQMNRLEDLVASSAKPPSIASIDLENMDPSLSTQPRLDVSSADILLLFDKQTCGILSVKDGPTENPWRTLIWPLAQDSLALYHAITSMTAFHNSYEIPSLRVHGMVDRNESIKQLHLEIENMRLDSALATSLILTFIEGWEQPISTGTQHLRGARAMVSKIMEEDAGVTEGSQMISTTLMRRRYLCNTFVYLDVIAKLTSLEESSGLLCDDILSTMNHSMGPLSEVDPLLGCAVSFFPLMDRTARLIKRVRQRKRNSLALVSEASELQLQLLRWRSPSATMFERFEDPESDVQHCIQTAEALRYATLLYLHQAVPEIPSEPAEELARKALLKLASVPPTGRATNLHIFPLFVASCEITDEEDRLWVRQRWEAMIARLKVCNVDACWEIVQEVWAKRDQHETEEASRRQESRALNILLRKDARSERTEIHDASATTEEPSITRESGSSSSYWPDKESAEELPQAYTVRGGLHWLAVMKDRQWEGKFTIHFRIYDKGLIISRWIQKYF